MPDDSAGASTATDSASTDAQPQGQATGGTAPAGDGQGGSGAQGATPGTDDRSAEAMLADAVTAGDDGGQDSGGGEDPLKAAQAEAARWRELARKQEKRAKENAEKAKNFDAYTESQKTEAQKRDEALAAAQREAAEARSYNWRLLACAQYDLDMDVMDDLRGSTEDEINASAERLSAVINKRVEAGVTAALAQAQANGGQQGQSRNGVGFRPVESLRPGALPASESKPTDPNAWLRNALTKKQ